MARWDPTAWQIDEAEFSALLEEYYDLPEDWSEHAKLRWLAEEIVKRKT